MRMVAPALALLIPLAVPGAASAYTLTLGGPPVGDAPSRFVEKDFPASRFAERPKASTAQDAPRTSSFGLKSMDSSTRLKTEKTLSDLGARQDGNRIVVSLPSDVLFDFDKYDIRADAQPVLARLSEALQAMSDRPVEIVGHTDAKGGDDYNQTLSERRAASVRDWLAGLGVDEARMTTAGKGESSPVAPNAHADGSDDPDGRQKNRRVEFVIGSGE